MLPWHFAGGMRQQPVDIATDVLYRGVQMIETNIAVLLSGTPARIRGVPVSNFEPETG